MDGSHGSVFTVDLLPKVIEQISTLAKKAEALGTLKSFTKALQSIVESLENNPLEWGEPEYHTRKPGGVVCHGCLPPLIVYYVVREPERIVWITKIVPLPGSALEKD